MWVYVAVEHIQNINTTITVEIVFVAITLFKKIKFLEKQFHSQNFIEKHHENISTHIKSKTSSKFHSLERGRNTSEVEVKALLP